MVSFSASDSGSGVNTANGELYRDPAPLSNGSCGTYTGYTAISASIGATVSYTDNSVSSNTCYEYEYVVSDNAGNQATITSTDVVEVDTTAPTNLLALAASPVGA